MPTRKEAAKWLEKHIVQVEENFTRYITKTPPLLISTDENDINFWVFEDTNVGGNSEIDSNYEVTIYLNVTEEDSVPRIKIFNDFNFAINYAKSCIERGIE